MGQSSACGNMRWCAIDNVVRVSNWIRLWPLKVIDEQSKREKNNTHLTIKSTALYNLNSKVCLHLVNWHYVALFCSFIEDYL